MKPRRFLFLALFALLVTGCDSAGENDSGPVVDGVYVINQGNFGDGNGSVTVLEPGANLARRDEITGLGSILQSAALIDGRLYLMANSADRIDIFDAETLEQTGQISGIVSPRYMIAADGTAFVTNFYANSGNFTGGSVTVIDLTENEKVDVIAVGDNPEGMALVGQRLYVANHAFGAGTTLSVIDLTTLAVQDTIDVDCDGPRFIIADSDEDVFVFCTGRTIYDDEFNVVGETDGAVRVLDGRTGEIVQRIAIDGRIGTEGPGQDAFHAGEAARIYAVKDQSTVLVFDTVTNMLLSEMGPFQGDAIGSVAFDEQREILYLGRAAGFVEAGSVTVHSDGGDQVGAANAGVAPSFIVLGRNR